jgi:hypothetical protein
VDDVLSLHFFSSSQTMATENNLFIFGSSDPFFFLFFWEFYAPDEPKRAHETDWGIH